MRRHQALQADLEVPYPIRLFYPPILIGHHSGRDFHQPPVVGIHVRFAAPVHAIRDGKAIPGHLHDEIADFPD